MQQITQLEQRAIGAARAGDHVTAERAWRALLDLAPDHPKALYSLGVHAFQRQSHEEALALLERARAASPTDPMVPLTMSLAWRALGNAQSEFQAIQASLAIDAYFLPALLALGAAEEAHQGAKAASTTYTNALKVAPPQDYWPEYLRPQLAHAQQVVQENQRALEDHLRAQVAKELADLPSGREGRWDETLAVASGRSEPYPSKSNQLLVTRLPAIPFFDRADFPWVEKLESKTEIIRGELERLLETQEGKFQPYIAYNPGEPVNQWVDLNHSRRWSTFSLWKSGAAVQENLDLCPQTLQALLDVQMADMEGLCPNAMFSALAPHTEIPPHNGETNARLIVHLPLIVPPNCLYRVGAEVREWTVGEVLIFDDTIEHTAVNNSDEVRVVLIFDVWNPLLSLEEREMVRAMTRATRSYYGIQ